MNKTTKIVNELNSMVNHTNPSVNRVLQIKKFLKRKKGKTIIFVIYVIRFYV